MPSGLSMSSRLVRCMSFQAPLRISHISVVMAVRTARAFVRAVSMQASLRATLECAKSFATTDFRPDLAAFKVPTLIIHGTADLTVPIEASAYAAAKGIANSKLMEYDAAPHGLFATEKARLTRDLLAFLRE